MRILIRLSIVFCLAAATSLQAITYIVPTDRDLVKRAEAIVIATAVESHSELRDGGRLVTVATLQVDRVIKGNVTGNSVELVEMGGAVGDRVMIIPGSPRYEPGTRYLVFLRTNQFGERVTYGFGLGKFEFTSDIAGRTLLSRGTEKEIFGFEESDWSAHVERLRAATEFINFVETVTKSDGPARMDYFLDRSSVVLRTFPEFLPRATAFTPIAESTRPDYMLAGNYRWQTPTATFVYCCSPNFEPGFNGPTDVSSAMGNWNGAGAGVNYSLGAVDDTANKGFTASDCKNAILFNDPNNEITGAAAIGGISTTGTICTPPPGQPSGPFSYSLPDGNTYSKTLEVDVVVGKSISTNEATFIGVLTHELGHTLGFRHADGTSDPLSPQNGHPCVAPSPCAGQGQAIMASVVAFNLSTLQQWDLDAVQTVYGSGPVCTPPSITSQPSGVTITAGQSTTLSVTAAGTSPTYQWFIGTAPSTATPAPSGITNQLTVSPSTTTNYWVRVSGCSTSVDSRTVTVTVNQPTCTPPSAPAPTATPSSISSGQSSTLTVNPTGTSPFTYQWFVGSSGNTANPINGQTNSSVSVSPTTTTSYWVRVTGQCAPAADSPATTVTVGTCAPPFAPTPTASPSSIAPGQSSTLTASPTGTGPFTYQWFTGASGDQSNPIPSATNSFTTVSPNVTTTYWVKVTGQCAPPSNSPATTVTVTCSPISGVSALPSTINVGQSSTLSVSTTGSGPFTFIWYRGSLGDVSNPIANTSSTIVSPTTNTSYWVHVTAPCGSQDTNVTVFVNAPCVPSSITTHPAFATIAPGASATLSVVAAGTAPISYQWYTGTSGNTNSPIPNATNASVTVSPTVTTSYWVHVANSCNTVGNNSTTAVVTVSATCPAATITTQPASVNAPIGSAATLHVDATVTGTTIHYQWYKGAKGDLSTKVGTDSPTFNTDTVAVTASYWVRLASACNNLTFTDSNAAVVTAIGTPKGRAVRH